MMRTKELKMKALRIVLLLVVAIFSLVPLQAQKLIKKELKTENKVADGFQYQWYMYTYSMGNSTLMAAFDLNGKRITPNGYKYKEKDGSEIPGVHYLGGGMFGVWSKNKDAFGSRIESGYNVKGECIFPEKNYICIFYDGDGLFSVSSHNDYGKQICGLYDYNGSCIIPESLGYGFVDYSQSEGLVWCNEEIMAEVKHTFSKDGRYYAEGQYSAYNREEFEKNKKPVSTLGGSYVSGSSSSNNSSSSSSTTTITTVTPTPTPQPQPQPRPMQVWKPCGICGGSGQCHICLGSGHSLQNPNSTCIFCNGTGKCSHCAGHGGQNVIEYH